MKKHKIFEKRVRVARRLLRRYLKPFAQSFLLERTVVPRPCFIVGCQRSGTNMLMDVLDGSLKVYAYGEGDARAFENFRIKPKSTRDRLLKKAKSPIVLFKPICDSQNIDILLSEHPNSKAIWIYRRFQDTTNSAVKKWGKGQLALIRLTATKPDWDYWLVERMRDEQRALVRELYYPEMSYHTAAALKWYLRNKIYFDYALDKNPGRIQLVKYEALVQEPISAFKRVFRFLDLDFKPGYVSGVFKSSIRKEVFPPIYPRVQKLCEDLQNG